MRSARSRWAGPPPLLLAATVLAIVVVPAMSSAEEGAPEPRAQLTARQTATAPAPSIVRGPAGPLRVTSKAGRAPAAATAAVAPKPQSIGVVTFNEFRRLDLAEAKADADRITSNPRVDIVGWQEGYTDGPVYASLAAGGWATRRYRHGGRELALSWRRSSFSLVSADQRRMAVGVNRLVGRYPFSDTWVLRVTLRDRASGRLLTVLDTHLPHKIEDLDDPGHFTDTFNAYRAERQLARMATMWAHLPGRWVIGTGDYNFDAEADMQVRTPGGVDRSFAGHAVSSYQALGMRGLQPTHPYTGRYLDYVHVASADLESRRVAFASQRTLDGFNSDHRPLLVRLILR